MNGPIFQNFPKFEQNWLKFKKTWVILLKVWPKIEQIGIWIGHFSLNNWYLFGSTFEFRGGT